VQLCYSKNNEKKTKDVTLVREIVKLREEREIKGVWEWKAVYARDVTRHDSEHPTVRSNHTRGMHGGL
jgi:predicted secreted Zn-dependent protease